MDKNRRVEIVKQYQSRNQNSPKETSYESTNWFRIRNSGQLTAGSNLPSCRLPGWEPYAECDGTAGIRGLADEYQSCAATSACRMGTQRSRGEDATGSTIQYVQGPGRCSWLLRHLFFRRTGKEECRSQPRARHARARSFEVHAGRTKSVG